MKEQDGNRSLESLFREKLLDFERSPSESFWKGFEKKLRMREFVSFRPNRFNIYYLTGLVAAGVAAGLLLFGNSPEEDKGTPDIVIDKTVTQQQVNTLEETTGNISYPGQTPSATGKKRVDARVNEKAGEKASRENYMSERPGEDKYLGSRLAEKISVDDKNRVPIENKLVLPKPVADFSCDRTSGCAPFSLSFDNLSLNYDSCIWEFSDGGTSSSIEPVWVFDEPGEYEVTLVVFGSGRSTAIKKQKILVYASPLARFEVNTGDPFLPDEQVKFYNYSEKSVSWQWDFGDGTRSNEFEPSHFYEKPGNYTVLLKAISEFGCTDSMLITNAFSDNSCYIIFPNAFTPNEGGPTGGYYSSRTDQSSEVFHPVWSGITQYQLRIFSKKGIILFETNDIEIGWDGYYKGYRAEPGVYIWKVRGVFKNGQPFVKGGDVTLLPKW